MKIGTIDLGYQPVILAPLEDITDPPFRRICKRYGCDLMYTEFISAEGLIRDADKSLLKLDFDEMERPVGIQIFGHDTPAMVRAAEVAAEANPDLIDINFGCPVKKVVNKGAGAGMLRNLPKMLEITKAVVEAVKIPVTVKTRLGWDETDKPIVSLAEQLQDVGIQALSIHGRTRSQLYSGKANWELIGEVKNNPRMHIPIIGNGDIVDAQTAKAAFDTWGVDGIMIGRGAIGNPWIFNEIKQYLQHGTIIDGPTLEERIAVCREQLEASVIWKGERTTLFESRKLYGSYFRGIRGIKQYRMRLVNAKSIEEVYDLLNEMKSDTELQ